jgi:hypothetical protein
MPTKQNINIGIQSNDGTGDSIRDAFRKTNDNFEILFSYLGLATGVRFFGVLEDTPAAAVPFSVLVTDSTGTTVTQVHLVGGRGISINTSSYSAGWIIDNTTSTLSTDNNPTLAQDLVGFGPGYKLVEISTITHVTTLTQVTQSWRAKQFANPIADQDLVTRKYLTDNFLSRSGVAPAGDETNTTTFITTLTGNISLIPVNTNTTGTIYNASILVYNSSGTTATISLRNQATSSTHITRKDYVDTKISLQGIDTIDPETGLPNQGFGRMTGPLILSRNPVTEDDTNFKGLIAATKQYVDDNSFYSAVNLFVTTNGRDYQPDVPPIRRGRAPQYAFKTVNKAAQVAEKLQATAKIEVGDYARLITYDNGTAATVLDVNDTVLGNNLSRLQLEVGSYGSDQFGAADIGLFTIFPGQYVQGVSSGAIGLIENISKPANPGDPELYSIAYVDYGDDFDTSVRTSIPDNANQNIIRFTFEDVPVQIVPIPDFWLGYKFYTDSGSPVTFYGTIVNIGSTVDNSGVYHNYFDVEYETGAPGADQVFSATAWHVYSGDFTVGETVVYNTNVSALQTTLVVESGEYYEQYPIKLPANVSIRGDEFRRTIIRPAAGPSASKWANTYFRRDAQTDGLQTSDLDTVTDYASGGTLINTSVSPNGSSGAVTMTLNAGSFPASYVGYIFVGNGGQGIVTSQNGNIFIVNLGTALTNATTIASGNWHLYKPITFGYHYLRDPLRPMNLLTTVDNPGGLENASALLSNNTNTNFIQDEVIKYLDTTFGTSGSFTYNQSKCARDTGLIVDAITQDILFSTSSQSTFAGLQYWNQGNQTTSTGLTTSTGAITFIQDLAQKIVLNDVSGTRYSTGTQVTNLTTSTTASAAIVKSKFDVILNILTTGTSGVTDIIVPNNLTASSTASIINAYNLLQANKTYIKQEAVAFVKNTSPTSLLNTASVYSNISDVVDSVSFDLLYSGNRQSIQSGVYYYTFDASSTAIPNEAVVTRAAYEHIRAILPYVIQGKAVPTTYGAVAQTTSTSIGSGVDIVQAQRKVDNITKIISVGPKIADAKSAINLTRSTTTSTINAANLIHANRAFIVAETIAFINDQLSGFVYDKTICRRDVGLIVGALAHDLIYGGSERTVVAGNSYRSLSVIQNSELIQTAAAVVYVGKIGAQIIANTPVTALSTATQFIDPSVSSELTANDVLADLVQALARIIGNDSNFNPPKDNSELDLFLMNDANVIRYISCQNHGGFMQVLDPVGQIKNKSPYTQTASSFSQSINKHAFRGGMLVDGFTGNVPCYPVDFTDPLALRVSGLIRRPQVPTFFVEKGVRYEVDYFADFAETGVLETGEPTYSATLKLNPIAPGGIPNAVIVVDNGINSFKVNQTNIPIIIEQPTGIGGVPATGHATSDDQGKIASIVIDFPGTGYKTQPYINVGGAILNNLVIVSGGITAVNIVTGGYGYAVGCPVTISPVGAIGGVNASGTVTAVSGDGLGTITAINITVNGANWTSNIAYRVMFGDLSISNVNPQSGYLDAVPQSLELITAGNRSMLANDFTQVNDLGYGIFVTNGGFMENVSMFTYYCHRSYYSLNGSQVRTLTGSSVYGNYGLVADGSDPLEVPLSVVNVFPLVQVASAYVNNPLYPAQAGQTYIYVQIDPLNGGYPPYNGSVVEINHGGIRRNYSIGAASQALNAQNEIIPNVYQLFFNSGNLSNTSSAGLLSAVAGGAPIIVRASTLVKVTGFNPVSITRPSTSLTWNDDPTYVYHITGFSTVQPDNSVYCYTQEDYNYIVFQSVDQGVVHPTLVGGGTGYSSTNTTITIGTANLLDNISHNVVGDQGRNTIGIQTITLNSVSSIKIGHRVSTSTYILSETFVTYVDAANSAICLNQPTNGYLPDGTTLNFRATQPTAHAVISSGTITNIVVDDGGAGWAASSTTINIAGTGTSASVISPVSIAGVAGSSIIKTSTLDLTSQNRIRAGLTASNPYYYEFAYGGTIYKITGYRTPSDTGESWAEMDLNKPLEESIAKGTILRAGVPVASKGGLTTKISILRATSHDFVDIGTGGYASNRIPNDLYGPPIQQRNQTQEVIELNKGRVYYVTSDQDGNVRIGKALVVNQAQGSVTISVPLDLSNLSSLSLRRDLGPPVNEFSIDSTMVSEADYKVPTEQAVANYINRRLGLDRNGNLYPGSPLGPQFLALDGQLAMKGNLNMNNVYRIINLQTPLNGTDGSTKDYVDTKISTQGTAGKDTNGITLKPQWGNMTGGLHLYRDPEVKYATVATTATVGSTQITFVNLTSSTYQPGDFFRHKVIGLGIPDSTFVTTVDNNGTKLGIGDEANNNVLTTDVIPPGTILTFVPVYQATTKKYVDTKNQLQTLNDVSLTGTTDKDLLMFTNVIVPVNTQSATPVYTQARQIVNVANDTTVINNTSATIAGGSDIQISRTGNSVNFKIRGGFANGATNPITDYHINSWAQIQQSKLLMNTATTTATWWVGTQSQVQAKLGLSSFDSQMFTATNGWVTLVNAISTATGVITNKMAWIPAGGGVLGSSNTAAATSATYLTSSTVKTWLGNESTVWSFATRLVPNPDLGHGLGSITQRWANVYANTGTFSAGIASSGTWNGSLISGIVMDYVTGLGRLTVGATDGFNFYNGNTSTRASLVSIDANGNVLQTGGTLGTQATTMNVFNTTATTVNAFGAATTLNIGNATAATVTLRPGTLVGANAIQSVYNTVATTVNAFQAATTLNVASTGGTTTVFSNLNVKGTTVFSDTVTFNGTATYVNSTNTVYTDNMLELHTPPGGVNATWSSTDGKDIGLRFHYYNAGDQNAALVLAHDSKSLEWYSTGAEANTGTFTGATYGTFKTGVAKFVSGNAATGNNNGTGDLQVSGGAGIAGSLYAGNIYDNSNRAITSVTATAGTGITVTGSTTGGPSASFTVNNNGVVSLTAGTAITVSGSGGGSWTVNNNGVTSLTAGTGVSVSNSAGGASTVSIGQSVATNAGVTFASVTMADLYGSGGSGIVHGSWTLASGATWQATFADLAEWYTSDAEYEPGTVLVFGGDKEVTITSVSNDIRVAGVVSTNAAYIMNVGIKGPGAACIALQGRVPVKVIGTVRKGDMLTTSNTPGYAIKAMNPQLGSIIGKALEDKTDPGMGVVEVAIGRM